MKFHVTQVDIDNSHKAVRGEKFDHPVNLLFVSPVVLCLERTTGRPWLLGHCCALCGDLDGGAYYHVPEHVSDRMRRFDSTNEMVPFSFELARAG